MIARFFKEKLFGNLKVDNMNIFDITRQKRY